MEHLVKGFIRVIRGLDAGGDVMHLTPDLEKQHEVSDPDKRRVLDFPEPGLQSTNISKSSSLAEVDLPKRAAESPNQLSASELDLLRGRYWLDVSLPELRAITTAHEALHAVSQDHWQEVTDRLKAIRTPFYDENEGTAIENASEEWARRLNETWQPELEQEENAILANPRLQPWVKRLFQENEEENSWGFDVYIHPDAAGSEERREEYMWRMDGALYNARSTVGIGSLARMVWRLQMLDWPLATDASNEQPRDSEKETELHDLNLSRSTTTQGGDQVRVGTFDQLRQHFISIRDEASAKKVTADTKEVESGGLDIGILRNVVLVIDHDARQFRSESCQTYRRYVGLNCRS
ncbi:hypothetical protein SUNI508_04532 [Seiridium unicorne]|uniref:Uncharacterized protein n=1 Tax=Seiridium unicorne TaxID=138068 RepID=A0ABR2V8S1_9PEZI